MRAARWPIREGLLCAVQRMREAAIRDYFADRQLWATKTAFGGDEKPPAIPPILQRRLGHG